VRQRKDRARQRLRCGLVLGGLLVAQWAATQTLPIEGHEFRTSDGVRLHYLEAGRGEPTLIFVPGWLMPAGIFEAQLAAVSKHHRVLALDPRSQGESELYAGPHTAERRAADIREFVEHVQPGPFVLVGWSLGVMESLDYVERTRPTDLRGLVLIDNSIGEASPPKPASTSPGATPMPLSRVQRLTAFVRGMFARPPSNELLNLIDASVLRVPDRVAAELLAKPYPREYYKQAIYHVRVPVLYAIRPRFEAQGEALKAHLDTARVAVYPNAGHALFVDEAQQFNADLERFVDALPTG
jgi:non-heme chloroperoxidase